MGIGRQIVHRLAVGHLDITGDDFGTIFAEEGAAMSDDTVQVVECRPLSRTKRWRLQKVLAKSTEA